MLTETITAISGIKTAMDMAKGISALKSEVEINQAIIDIQRTLLDAQAAAFGDRETIARLSDEKKALEIQLKAISNWDNEKQRYVLTRSEMGAYTYDLRPELSNGEVAHRLCATCFEDGKKSILHITANHNNGEMVQCKNCNTTFCLKDFSLRQETTSVRNLPGGY
jgi:membrane protease subunit (stomatin/prohibitin family)